MTKSDAFPAGARIEVVGGPWPERIGLHGVVVKDPGDGIYPFSGRLPSEVVVLIDDDPHHRAGDWWSCAIGVGDIELEAP